VEIRTENRGSATIVRIDGHIDVLTSMVVRQVIDKTLNGTSVSIVIDLTHVEHIDASGFGWLIRLRNDLARSGSVLRLFGMRDVSRKVLGRSIEMYENEEDATAR